MDIKEEVSSSAKGKATTPDQEGSLERTRELTLKEGQQDRVTRLTDTHDGVTYNRSMMADLCKEIYKENMGHYRYFGTLRARTVYTPATIAMAALSVFAVVTENLIACMVFVAIVFGLTLRANYFLQTKQRVCALICRYAQDDWNALAIGQSIDLVDSRKYLARAQNNKIPLFQRFDPPSLILTGFLACIAALPIVVVGPYNAAVSSAILGWFQLDTLDETKPGVQNAPQASPQGNDN
ncbi:MAG: hypothetical protein AAF636_16070 [Pseudomonadota bacterium]